MKFKWFQNLFKQHEKKGLAEWELDLAKRIVTIKVHECNVPLAYKGIWKIMKSKVKNNIIPLNVRGGSFVSKQLFDLCRLDIEDIFNKNRYKLLRVKPLSMTFKDGYFYFYYSLEYEKV